MLLNMRKHSSMDLMDPTYKRMIYIRYVDDFVFLVIGSHNDCKNLVNKSKDFLKTHCGLELNLKKTLITTTNKHFSFLGAELVKLPRSMFLSKRYKNNIRMVAQTRLQIKAPIQRLLETLIGAKLARRNHLGVIYPQRCTPLINLSHLEILRFYNSKVRGLINYYSFATNRPKLWRIIWLLKASCALTLVSKLKLDNMGKAFKRFGKVLTDPDTGESFYQPKTMAVTHTYRVKSPVVDNPENIISLKQHG